MIGCPQALMEITGADKGKQSMGAVDAIQTPTVSLTIAVGGRSVKVRKLTLVRRVESKRIGDKLSTVKVPHVPSPRVPRVDPLVHRILGSILHKVEVTTEENWDLKVPEVSKKIT